jgi:hypothetical protein
MARKWDCDVSSGDEPSKEKHKKATASKIFILINCIVSLLILFFSTLISIADKNIDVILFPLIFIPLQWGVFYLIKWSIHYLIRKSPTNWRAVLSVWIACAAFLMLSLNCFRLTDEEDISAQFIIGSISIAAVLATVLFSLKKMRRE